MSGAPDWGTQFGLVQKGNYYEGCVDDLSAVLDTYKHNTVSTWGTEGLVKLVIKRILHVKRYFKIDYGSWLTILMQNKGIRLFWTLSYC